MEINLSGKKGRSTVTSVIDVSDLKQEENIQEVFLAFVDFLHTMGAEFPEEFEQLLDEHYGDS